MLSTRALPILAAVSFLFIAAGLSVITWTLPAQAQAPQPTPPDIRELKALYQRPPARPIESQALVDLGPAHIRVGQDRVRDLPFPLSRLGDH
jgi:hypothetical protein